MTTRIRKLEQFPTDTIDMPALLTLLNSFKNGDFSVRLPGDKTGVTGKIYDTLNEIIENADHLNNELARVNQAVGKEGKLRRRALLPKANGSWAECVESVNGLVSDLVQPVSDFSRVIGALARGDLTQRMAQDVDGRQLKGELQRMVKTVNEMIDTLATFAEQVTTVAREVGVEGKLGGQASVPGATGTWRDLTDNVNRLAANLTTQVRAIAEVATAVTQWDLSRSITVEAAGEVAALKDNINEMIRNLRETTEKSTSQDWLKTNVARFTRLLQGQRDPLSLSRLILSELAPLVGIQHGVFYLNESVDGEPELRLLASYAYRDRKHLSDRFRVGEGLVGQAAFEKQRILVTQVPPDYIRIVSGLGQATPANIVMIPVLFEGDVKAVIELASFQPFTDIHLTFLDQVAEIIGIILNTITATMRTEQLLKQSQALAMELTSRQAELTETNARLQEQARQLSSQNQEVERKNAEIESARRSVEEKAEQLAVSSKYKSEFLANMSHELRTPLNSLLILSKLMTDNSERNLLPKQLDYVRTIYESGSDLLTLINEILDLSKIEAGAMRVEIGRVQISEITDYVERTFRHVADEREIGFTTSMAVDVPAFMFTDMQRLQQILKNLLSNAFKFTDHGEVRFSIESARSGWNRMHDSLNNAETVIAFKVSDSGIGISTDKQAVVFEAFQQAEGGMNRKYGGTGLGLCISRELVRLLGGEIRLVSEPNKGSTFTAYLPHSYPITKRSAQPQQVQDPALRNTAAAIPFSTLPETAVPMPPQAEEESRERPLTVKAAIDDRADVHDGDRTILLVEDDVRFARIMLDIAHDSGFKGLIALSGEEALRLAHRFRPEAITLDLHLPGVHGWSVLDRLKHDPQVRHIPVQVISAFDERNFSLQMGAIGYLRKPVTHEQLLKAFQDLRQFSEIQIKNLLIVEDDATLRNTMTEIVGNGDVHTFAVGTGEEALRVLQENRIDCLVLDLGLPRLNGFQLIDQIRQLGQSDLRIVIYTGRELTKQEAGELKRVAESIIIKEANSLDRLLDETSLFLHRPTSRLPASKQRKLEEVRHADSMLQGKKILIIDDDIRNIFALTSLFENYNVNVLYAENGEDGIRLLEENADTDAALIDIMMPGIDGYETIRRIRNKKEWASLPILALTAKAMKGDREACLDAGATDYVAKPADTDQLLSILRVQLARQSTS